ncbi:hydroxyacylglutathione hydrolase [Pseudohalioglobus lutimaris]|uniref:Hydroxyacylglutathione hydrolase n=1 Tax=Pseudohalioglobus lutimaris TaxID=1737061 RepID=A0A2N5X309_9GAMM|nr:hydroxyacylglutathione hydrolase [Pseudohalioglobus lutimaris]PLW68884.1 hydroxyacylglutathione hydrolase [Pseudohalioglobus lutimaris]
MLNIEPIPAFNDNYIWLVTRPGESGAFVVDPGDAAVVEAALAARQLQLAGILITHHHFDHVGGVLQLRETHDPVVYGPFNPAIEGVDVRVAAGDQVEVLGAAFEVMEVPGHTLDHIAYFARSDDSAQDSPVLFCGDTLFAAGCGRLFEGTPAMMHASLQALVALPADTRVYCAHEYTLANLAFAEAVEPENAELAERLRQARATREQGEPTVPSTLSLELDTNPFVRCQQPAVLDSLRSQGKLQGTDAEAVFAAVRGWKDNF